MSNSLEQVRILAKAVLALFGVVSLIGCDINGSAETYSNRPIVTFDSIQESATWDKAYKIILSLPIVYIGPELDTIHCNTNLVIVDPPEFGLQFDPRETTSKTTRQNIYTQTPNNTVEVRENLRWTHPCVPFIDTTQIIHRHVNLKPNNIDDRPYFLTRGYPVFLKNYTKDTVRTYPFLDFKLISADTYNQSTLLTYDMPVDYLGTRVYQWNPGEIIVLFLPCFSGDNLRKVRLITPEEPSITSNTIEVWTNIE